MQARPHGLPGENRHINADNNHVYKCLRAKLQSTFRLCAARVHTGTKRRSACEHQHTHPSLDLFFLLPPHRPWGHLGTAVKNQNASCAAPLTMQRKRVSPPRSLLLQMLCSNLCLRVCRSDEGHTLSSVRTSQAQSHNTRQAAQSETKTRIVCATLRL